MRIKQKPETEISRKFPVVIHARVTKRERKKFLARGGASWLREKLAEAPVKA